MREQATKTAGLLFLVMVLANSVGCGALTFQNPLVKPSEAKLHRELYGSYRGTDEQGTHFVHVGSAGKEFPTGVMRAVFISLPNDWWEPIKTDEEVMFCVEKVGEYYVAQMPAGALKKEEEKGEKINWHKEWEAAKTRGYLVGLRIKKTDDGLELTPIDPGFIEAQLTAKKLPGTVEPKKTKVKFLNQEHEVDVRDLKVSASTEELQKFFKEHIDGKLFGGMTQKWKQVK